MVVAETLLGIEGCAYGVADATRANQREKWGRGLLPKERDEDYNHPTHNQIDGEANRRNRTLRQRLVEDAEQHHNPLNHNNQHTLPTANHAERDRGVGASNGEVDHYVVEYVEYRLVLRLGLHRVVERRAEEHQKDADDKDRDTHRGEHWVCGVMGVGPHSREG